MAWVLGWWPSPIMKGQFNSLVALISIHLASLSGVTSCHLQMATKLAGEGVTVCERNPLRPGDPRRCFLVVITPILTRYGGGCLMGFIPRVVPPPSNSHKCRFIGIPYPKNVMSSWSVTRFRIQGPGGQLGSCPILYRQTHTPED